jgi:hypothetical protein
MGIWRLKTQNHNYKVFLVVAWFAAKKKKKKKKYRKLSSVQPKSKLLW